MPARTVIVKVRVKKQPEPVCVKCGMKLPAGARYCAFCGKKQAPEKRKRRKRANSSGTIYKQGGRRSKPWAARRNGVFLGAFASYAEAQKALERTTDTDVTDRFNMTFSQVFRAWYPEHERTVSKSGAAGYQYAYRRCEGLYNKKFRSLRASDFQAVILRMEQDGLSKSSCEKVLQLFGQMSKWAIRENIAVTNYAPFVTIRAKQKTTRTAFSAEQIAAIQKSPLPAAKIALILIGCGCRPGELFSVPLRNCYDDYFIGGSKTKAGRDRIIAVSEIGLDAYRGLLAKAREEGDERLIDAYEGNTLPANFAKRDFAELMEALKLPDMTPYNCRHTFTTLAVKAGVKPEWLQKMLGHASYTTTIGTYAHLDKTDILKEIKKVSVVSKLSAKEKVVRKQT